MRHREDPKFNSADRIIAFVLGDIAGDYYQDSLPRLRQHAEENAGKPGFLTPVGQVRNHARDLYEKLAVQNPPGRVKTDEEVDSFLISLLEVPEQSREIKALARLINKKKEHPGPVAAFSKSETRTIEKALGSSDNTGISAAAFSRAVRRKISGGGCA